MMLFDIAPLGPEMIAGAGIIIFSLLFFAGIIFVIYKLLKRKK